MELSMIFFSTSQATGGIFMATTAKPGERPPRPGEYKPVGPRGGLVDAPNVTIDGNEGHMPPTPDNGQLWERIGPPKK